jgi:hypothetical protein
MFTQTYKNFIYNSINKIIKIKLLNSNLINKNKKKKTYWFFFFNFG